MLTVSPFVRSYTMTPQIDFSDLLATVNALNKSLDDIDKGILGERKKIDALRLEITQYYNSIDIFELHRQKVKDAIRSLSSAMATVIQGDRKNLIELYQKTGTKIDIKAA
jgi:hypothetical protein